MTIKTKQFLLCNKCDTAVTDITKAIKISGVIGRFSSETIEKRVVSDEGDQLFHETCLAQLLGMQMIPTYEPRGFFGTGETRPRSISDYLGEGDDRHRLTSPHPVDGK